MTQQTSADPETEPSGFGRYVPLLVCSITILVLLAIPFKVISYGYLPYDDALRHAAKAVSGKSWPEILVLGDSYKMDSNFGWHVFLEQANHLLKCNAEGLVIFSVVFLFVLMTCSVLPWLRRPEAWLATLFLVSSVTGFAERSMFGRPFLLTMSALLTILLVWHNRSPKPPSWRIVLGFSLLIATGVFVHGIWYLWALPVAAFFLAREYVWGLALAAACGIGTALGALLTGHPVDYLAQSLQLAFGSLGMHTVQRTLTVELQPSAINPFILILLGGILIARHIAGSKVRPLTANPAFWLTCICLVLGLKVERFLDDWGLPALAVLLAAEFQPVLQARMAAHSLKRLGLTAGLALATYMSFTADLGSRWTHNLTTQYLTRDNPALTGWLPDRGGVFYSAEILLFYQTFLKNPRAEWRYILGYEPTLMPAEDFQIFNRILWNYGEAETYKPWVEKMRPEDRLVVTGNKGAPPQIPGLEWNFPVNGIWIGRLPRTNVAPAAVNP